MKILTYQLACVSNIADPVSESIEPRSIVTTVRIENPTDAEIDHARDYAYEGNFSIEDDGAEYIPTEQEDTAAMLVDHEYRLTLLELGLTEY